MVFADHGAGRTQNTDAVALFRIALQGGSIAEKLLDDVLGDWVPIQHAGQQPLRRLAQQLRRRFEIFFALRTESAFRNLPQGRRFDAELSKKPAAALIPVFDPVVEIAAGQLTVIGQRQPSGRCRAEDRRNDSRFPGKLVPITGKGGMQLLIEVSRDCENGSVFLLFAEGILRTGHFFPLRIPAYKGTIRDGFALRRRHPLQGAVRLLGGCGGDRTGLHRILKAAAVGKIAGIVGRNQLCAVAGRNDPLVMTEA